MAETYYASKRLLIKTLVCSIVISVVAFLIGGVITLSLLGAAAIGIACLALLLFVFRGVFDCLGKRVEVSAEALVIVEGKTRRVYPRSERRLFALSYDCERQVIEADYTTRVGFPESLDLSFLSREDYRAVLKALDIVVGRR